jgi:hypothetical protein
VFAAAATDASPAEFVVTVATVDAPFNSAVAPGGSGEVKVTFTPGTGFP